MGERWLKAEATAAYTNIRIDYLKRYVKAGKLPPILPPWAKIAALGSGGSGRPIPRQPSSIR